MIGDWEENGYRLRRLVEILGVGLINENIKDKGGSWMEKRDENLCEIIKWIEILS